MINLPELIRRRMHTHNIRLERKSGVFNRKCSYRVRSLNMILIKIFAHWLC